MSLTSTDLATAMGAHVLGYTQPKHPIYRITYEVLEAQHKYDEHYGDSVDTEISTHQAIVEGVPDTHPVLQQDYPRSQGLRVLNSYNNLNKTLNPYNFNQLIQEHAIIPQTIMSEIYNKADQNGLGMGKHHQLPLIRHVDHANSRVLTIYKIEHIV